MSWSALHWTQRPGGDEIDDLVDEPKETCRLEDEADGFEESKGLVDEINEFNELEHEVGNMVDGEGKLEDEPGGLVDEINEINLEGAVHDLMDEPKES